MPESREGQHVPDVTLHIRENAHWREVRTGELFAGRKVVVFGLPGAFTPTCSSSHVPRYEELYDQFREQGVDEILCVSVNDAFVMNAWKEQERAEHLTFLPDGNGTFTEALGMLVDKSDEGYGERSWRYSMLVDDGVIDKMFVEPERPGDPYEVSDADTMLEYLGGHAIPDILLFTRPGCPHCARAKEALGRAHLRYAELPSSPRILRALPGNRTTPQIYVNGRHLGGADELVAWLAKRNEQEQELAPA